MAKELPYFKFEPNAWENGNIQMLSREDKGLFIDICSMFWSRLGDLPEKLVLQKLCAGNATALIPLYEEKIIELIDGSIYVKFLSIQLQEFENTSNQNSENAKARWKKYHEQKALSERNATALNRQCEIDAIREEERREDENKEEYNTLTAKAETIDFNSLLEYLNLKTGRSFRTVNNTVKKKYKTALKQGYTKEDIKTAIDNAVKAKNHIDNNFQYLTMEFFSRPEKLDMYSAKIELVKNDNETAEEKELRERIEFAKSVKIH